MHVSFPLEGRVLFASDCVQESTGLAYGPRLIMDPTKAPVLEHLQAHLDGARSGPPPAHEQPRLLPQLDPHLAWSPCGECNATGICRSCTHGLARVPGAKDFQTHTFGSMGSIPKPLITHVSCMRCFETGFCPTCRGLGFVMMSAPRDRRKSGAPEAQTNATPLSTVRAAKMRPLVGSWTPCTACNLTGHCACKEGLVPTGVTSQKFVMSSMSPQNQVMLEQRIFGCI
jgi:hypothetical protein